MARKPTSSVSSQRGGISVVELSITNGHGDRKFTMQELAEVKPVEYFTPLRRTVLARVEAIVNLGRRTRIPMDDHVDKAGEFFITHGSYAFTVKSWRGVWAIKSLRIFRTSLSHDGKLCDVVDAAGLVSDAVAHEIDVQIDSMELDVLFQDLFGDHADAYERVYSRLMMLLPGYYEGLEETCRATDERLSELRHDILTATKLLRGGQGDQQFLKSHVAHLRAEKRVLEARHQDLVALKKLADNEIDNLRQCVLAATSDLHEPVETVITRACAARAMICLAQPSNKRSPIESAICDTLSNAIKLGSKKDCRSSIAAIVLQQSGLSPAMSAEVLGIDGHSEAARKAVRRFRKKVEAEIAHVPLSDGERVDLIETVLPKHDSGNTSAERVMVS